MINHKTSPPQVEHYFEPGSPDAVVWSRSNTLRNAIARATSSVAAVSPEILYAPAPQVVETAEQAPRPMSPVSVPAPAAGEVALSGTVSQISETPVGAPTILEDDPMHEISQEMFLQAARQGVLQAQQAGSIDQEPINA